MRKNKNQQTISGYLFSSDLEKRTSGPNSKNPGTPFIRGSVNVATDEDAVNVIQVNYTYVTETTKKGTPNNVWKRLSEVMDAAADGKTVEQSGVQGALVVKLTPSLSVNDYYNLQNDQMVSYQQNEGGFVNIITSRDLPSDESQRAKFEVDAILTGLTIVEPTDDDHNPDMFAKLNGYIFNFRNDIMPFEFVVRNEAAINYFEDMELSTKNPLYTQLRGQVKNSVVVKTREIESAFGEAAVDTVTRYVREWEVQWAQAEPYELGAEETITSEELQKALSDRETMLAETKANRIAYEEQASSAGNAFQPTPKVEDSTIPTGGFSF